MQYNFGVGLLSFTPSGSNPTPVQVGVLQEVGLDIEESVAELRGQYKFPVDVAHAAGKIAGKAKFGQIFGAVLSTLFSSDASIATGTTRGAINEVGTIPATPYIVTVTNSATFVEDLGVVDITTGRPMTRVASGPTTGQYAVTAGAYTFAAADTTHTVWISYSYTNTGGKTVTFINALMGQGPTFTLTLFNQYASNYYGVKLFAAKVPKLSRGMKNTDYTMSDLDFVAYANSSGRILEEYASE